MPQDTIPTSIFDIKARYTLEWKLHWLFRLALCCEFVGHGAFGVLTKQAWVVYFGIFGIPESWAWKLMPVVGCVDIILGILALVLPTRAGLLYMGCWGFFTASLRPLAGEAWWEFLERSYNFGVPLLMPWVHSVGTRRPSWFTVMTEMPRFTVARAQTAQLVLHVGHPFERHFRDVHVLLQHSSKSSARYGSAGRLMFGLENDWVWLSF
jgi:hypothetical protein